MKERIAKLREFSLAAVPSISAERALLLTEFYSGTKPAGESVPVQRALAFEHILKSKAIYIHSGELIVGERGPAPKATPTYPEVCLHSLDDLDLLNSRKKLPYQVAAEARSVYEEQIIPFWQGRNQRERLLSEMKPEWLVAYRAGVFTEFQEQRSPGHTVLGDKIYKLGMADFQAQIRSAIDALDFHTDPAAYDKQEQLKAMDIAAGALVTLAKRHAVKLRELVVGEGDAARRAELEEMAAVCEHVPANAPRTFHEALQYYWFVHLGVITELNPWDSFNPGRLDQHLLPFYRQGLADGSLTEDRARELLQAFWIKFNNQPAPPKVGVTAKESNTYTDFALINVGGVDRNGKDAVNELTLLILDVIEEMRLLQPSSMVQVSRRNDDRHLRRAMKIIRTGYGQPSIFNTDAIVQEMVRQGKSIEDAREGGASGCVETGAFGRECYILTGYFNLPKVLEITLNNGIDPRTGELIGIATGNAAEFTDFDELFAVYEQQLNYFIDIKVRGNNVIDRLFARYIPAPFLSVLIDDCIENGRDYHDGGARYNTSYIQGVGLGSITDSLSALKYHVYDTGSITMADFLAALSADFAGYADLREAVLNATPKYGNDDDYADGIMQRVFRAYFNAVDGRPCARGGEHRVNMLPTTCHVYFGSVIGALPDGRLGGQPLSEGISPVQGADRKGPTAVLNSAGKLDHLKTGGTLLNQKLSPELLKDEAGIDAAVNLVRTYFRMDGHHIQFNVVKAETLRAAQREPEQHRDLIVRVAGYSDYFVDLTEALQEEIIRRTEHLTG